MSLTQPGRRFWTFASIAIALACNAPLCAYAQESTSSQEESADVIVVQATRSGRDVEDEPLRVDVIDEEEVSEKQLMVPGNVSMLINETVGVKMQVTSPALGSANIRMQGINGKYAQLLGDGLPLYGGSSLGIMQIPPTDIAQVEVIKGAASALYGPSALGGVINMVSRRPQSELQTDLLANISNRDGRDVTGYAAMPLDETWGLSAAAAYNRQTGKDLDGDGWADIPGYERWSARPRLFWDGENRGQAVVTLGVMTEQRQGGTRPGRNAPDGQPFVQAQDTRRLDVGMVAEFPLETPGVLRLRASAMSEDHTHRFGPLREDDQHATLFGEASLSGEVGATSLLGGVALQQDQFTSEAFAAFDYTYTTPAVFAQVEHELIDDLTLAASGRLDAHSRYGTFLSPRVSALYKPGDVTLRASLGQGFFAPTPFVEEVEAAGLSRLAPLAGLKAETAETASFDVGYRRDNWQASLTLFGSDIHDAIRLDETGQNRGASGDVELVNIRGVTRTRGAEATFRVRWDEITLSGSYVYVDAHAPDPSGSGRRAVPLTPQHTGGLDFMWERPGQSRLGIEAYYTGEQELENNPYRKMGRAYLELGLFGELIFDNISVFLNAENLLDVRQTKDDPLLLPQRAADGQWTVDVWKPLDGLVVNAGVRIR